MEQAKKIGGQALKAIVSVARAVVDGVQRVVGGVVKRIRSR
jgi:hypothetical protein